MYRESHTSHNKDTDIAGSFLSVAKPTGVQLLVFFCSCVPVVLFDTPRISRCRSQHVSVEASSLFHHSIYLWFICFPWWFTDELENTHTHKWTSRKDPMAHRMVLAHLSSEQQRCWSDLRGWAGWSAPLLFAYAIRYIFAWPGPFYKKTHDQFGSHNVCISLLQ